MSQVEAKHFWNTIQHADDCGYGIGHSDVCETLNSLVLLVLQFRCALDARPILCVVFSKPKRAVSVTALITALLDPAVTDVAVLVPARLVTVVRHPEQVIE